MKSSFMTVIQIGMSLRESDQVVTSLRGGSDRMIVYLPVVCEFPEVILNEINDLPSEHEVKFVIDLIPSTSSVSMDIYRMYASKLS